MRDSPSKDFKNTREPIVEGIFYPDKPDELQQKIEELLKASSITPGDNPAIITPHAGLQYAGQIMASAFKAVAKHDTATVVILAPTHRETNNEVIFPESYFFRTPLGTIPVNQKLVEELLSCSTLFLRNDLPHLEEHCIEVLLPFIQVIFPHAEIIPILINKNSTKAVKALANAFQLIFSDNCDKMLFIASSNAAFSFKTDLAEGEANRFIELIALQNDQELISSLENKEISACGVNAVAAMLAFMKKNYTVKVLEQGHSHQTHPASSTVVHYAAIALCSEQVL